MIKRLVTWNTTEDKIKSLVVWMVMGFALAGFWTVYRWWSWLVTPTPQYWYLDKGWLYTLTTLNIAVFFFLGVQAILVMMLRNYYQNRKEIYREEIVRERTGHPDEEEEFPFYPFQEVEPEDNEDYHAKRQEQMTTASKLMKLLKEKPPGSLSEVNAMLADPYIDKVKKARLYLLNLRRKFTRQEDKKKEPELELAD